RVVEPGTAALAAIAEHFGPGVLQADGSLDRAALRAVVFNAPDERRWLESLTHPLIGARLAADLDAAASPYVVLSSPLLLEGSQRDLVDHVVVVDVPETLQVERASARDNNAPGLVRKIMAAQLPREKRRALADTVIDNSGDLAALEQRTEDLHHRLLQLAAQREQVP
ncbi:MAG: dephospho-CoA kinase, partial [Halieaceae bacterium]|nr:dephospho-CoA kinase [Halieaceae bacterium]